MTDAPFNPPREPLPDGGLLRFEHEAMHTTFAAVLVCDEPDYAAGAAQAAWDEVDRLELELSRFNEASDVFQLSLLPVGRELRVSLDVFECLRIARRVWEQTGGAFDPTLGRMDQLGLDERTLGLTAATRGIELDLGGIAKGYAADRVGELLREWSLGDALVEAGASSVLALGAPPGMSRWPLPIADPLSPTRPLGYVHLSGAALGVSGTQQQGAHVIDPRTGRAGESRPAACALADAAAEADALATAFMTMDAAQIETLCTQRPDLGAILADLADDGLIVRRFGDTR